MLKLTRRNALRLGLLAAASPLAAARVTVAGERAPLAIKGYDPVAYFTDAKAVSGLPQFELEWDERRYRFASAKHLAMFKANPVRYAPQFANYCAMALSEGYVTEANPKYWLVSDGKLYIFGQPEGADRFRRDLARHEAKANENRWMVAKP